MTITIVVVWSIAGGFIAWRSRPPARRSTTHGSSTHGSTMHASAAAERFGGVLVGVVPWLSPVSPRWIGTVVVVAVVTVPILGPPSLVVGVATLAVLRTTSRRAATLRDERELADLSCIADLLRVAVSSGLNPGAALVAVHHHLRAGSDAGLGNVVADLDRGRGVADALAVWAGVGPRAELAALVRSADDGGVAVVDALGRLANDFRRRRRRSAEQRARRLPVTMLLPLVACVLPAFGLLTVVPMVAVGFERLGGLP